MAGRQMAELRGKRMGEHLVCSPCGNLATPHAGGKTRFARAGRTGGAAVALADVNLQL